MSQARRPALFVDRDGVLVEDVGLLTRPEELAILPGVPAALSRASRAGYVVVVVTNQTVVARGLATEKQVEEVNAALARQLREQGGGSPSAFYVCPHHPHADVAEYRRACDCRKPAPGLLLRAALDLDLDLAASVMVGDRNPDVLAGTRAGCRTVLVESGAHAAPPIVGMEAVDAVEPTHRCADLAQAVELLTAEEPR